MAHAVVNAALALAKGDNVLADAAGATVAEATGMIAESYYHKSAAELTETEKQTVSTLATLAAGLAGGLTGDSTASVVSGAQTGKTTVENNYLSNTQQAQKKEELSKCQTAACKASTQAKWTAISLGQDGSFAAGMVAGVPAGLYDTVEGLVKTASSPMETYEALKSLFNSDDVLGTVSDAVKQSYIKRINRMEAEYQRAGAGGSFNAGVEGGKLVADIAGLLAGGAGVAKGGVVLTEKVVAKVAGKAESAAARAGKATSGAENVALYPKLKDDLMRQNLENIAKQDPRLAVAVKGSGTKNPNFSIGMGTAAEADRLGKIWVGDGAKLVTNQKECPGCLVSADGTRLYRPPTIKPNTPAQFNPTGVQANFQILKIDPINGKAKTISNGHLSVKE